MKYLSEKAHSENTHLTKSKVTGGKGACVADKIFNRGQKNEFIVLLNKVNLFKYLKL